jgi:hypothetical protein
MTDRNEKQIVRRAPIKKVSRVSTKGYEPPRAAAFRGNDGGWAAQLQRVEGHVSRTL